MSEEEIVTPYMPLIRRSPKPRLFDIGDLIEIKRLERQGKSDDEIVEIMNKLISEDARRFAKQGKL